jgi:acyl carrier protein
MRTDREQGDAAAAREGVLEIFGELLGAEVDPSQAFIAQGGDSIRAMQGTARVHRRLGISMPPDVLLTAKSVDRAIGAAIAEEPTLESASGAEINPDAASRGQQQLWFIDALGDGTALYNISSAVHFRGEIELERLTDSIAATLAAHDSLRTAFREGDKGLQRMALAEAAPRPVLNDLAERPAQQAESEYREIAARASTGPFSLATGPVARAVLVRRRANLCSLVLVAHHTALDAWSLGLLCDEIVTRYEATRDEAEPAELRFEPYSSFVRAEARAKAERGEQDLRWWRDYLSGAPTQLALPSELERPAWQDFRGSRTSFELGDADRLREVSRELVATPFTVLLAAFGLCLRRETGASDFLVGVPIAGRDEAALQDIVGFCAKLLPVRIVLANDSETFAAFAGRLKNSISMVLRHASVDLADLVRELSLSGDPSRNPLVQIVFAKHDDLISHGGAPGELELDFEDLDTGSSPVDLTLFVESLDPPTRGAIEHATAVVSDAAAQRFAARYSAVLEAVLADPRRPLGEFSPVSS